MKITVIGCGRWGSFIAWYLDSISHNVTLYGRPDSANFTALALYRRNEYITLPSSINLTSELSQAHDSDVIIISIPSQNLRALCRELKLLGICNKTIVLCMKGLEADTGLRLSQVAKNVCGDSNNIAVWLGPGHPEDFLSGIPSCMVIDSDNEETKHLLVNEFSSKLIRFYYGSDMIGDEIGAALKNVIGIAAGILDGLNMSSLKGPLMSRGTKEVSRLISAAGGKSESAYGLCHLGDYEATLFSKHSHNRKFGETIVAKKDFNKLAEGCYTVRAVIDLCDKYNIEMPICKGVYDILYNNAIPKQTVEGLFSRRLIYENEPANTNIGTQNEEL